MTSFESGEKKQTQRPARRRRRRSDRGHWGQSLLGWIALVFVFLTALRNGGIDPGIWTLLCLGAFVLLAAQVVFDLRFGLPRPARAALWIAVPFGAVLLWLTAQSMTGLAPALSHPVWQAAPDGAAPTISAFPDAGRNVVMRLICYASLFWISLRSAAASHSGGVGYIQAIALFSTALAIYGLVSTTTGYNVLLGIEESTRMVRASFLNQNAYATFAVFGLLANITAYIRSVSADTAAPDRFALRTFLEAFFSSGWLFAFGALVGLVGLALTASRAGVAAGVIGGIVLVWALRRGSGRGGLAVWIIPTALLGFVALFMSSSLIASIGTADDASRFGVYRQVVVGIGDRPVLGHGAGAFQDAFRVYVPLDHARYEWERAHSTYLEQAFEFGLPAAVLFFLALGLVGRRLLAGVLVRRRHQAIPAYALACFVAAAFHAGFDFSLQFPANAALFAAILGIGWGQSYPTRRARRSDSGPSQSQATDHNVPRPGT